MSSVSAIAKFYAGRSVFITGGTGFVGKQTIEKLLRSCPEIERIYVLMRSKKNKTVEQRLESISKLPLFARLSREQPNFMEKIVIVSGDLLQPGLGISDADRSQISSNVSIVFHSAAAIGFIQPIRDAVASNILGTRYAIQLAQSLKNPEGFVYVSTAYSNPEKSEVEEKVYDPLMEPQNLIDLVNTLDDEQLTKMTQNILGQFPNTYTYTKAVAERLVENEIGSIPSAIVRPSIICPSMKEPFEGWVDNMTGGNGMAAGIGLGFVTYVNCKCAKSPKMDIIPIDLVANAVVTVGWDIVLNKTAEQDSSKVTVYNLITGDRSPLTLGESGEYVVRYANEHPLSYNIRHPSRFFQVHNKRYWLYLKFDEYIELPLRCYVADAVSKILGRKPSATTTMLRFAKLREAFEFFFSNEWNWKTDNLVGLEKRLSPVDREIFSLNRDINWDDYHRIAWLGVKRFVDREPFELLLFAKENAPRHENPEADDTSSNELKH